jgi:DNA-binding MarR family transcriptional regulator
MPKRYLDGILAGWMLVSVGTVVAEDNPPAAPPKVEAEAARAKSPESDPRLPPIPLQVLTALASNTTTGSFVLGQAYDLTAVCRELEITDAQRADMSKLMQPHHRWNLSLQKARQVFFEGPQIGFGGASQALTMAFELLEQRESRRLAASLEAPLTPAQRAGLRRKFRGAGSDELVRRNTPKHLHSSMDSGRVEAFTRAGDQLSLLLVGSVQDQLELTDEQFLALCDVRDRAVVAAIQLIEAEMALAEQTTPPATVFGSTTLGGIFADAVKELSDEQRQTFGKFFENPAPERMRELMRGGATRIQQVNDQVQAEVTIPNPVENSEELRQALNLTDEQRKKFAAAIKVEEEKVKQRIIDNAGTSSWRTNRHPPGVPRSARPSSTNGTERPWRCSPPSSSPSSGTRSGGPGGSCRCWIRNSASNWSSPNGNRRTFASCWSRTVLWKWPSNHSSNRGRKRTTS